MIFQGHWRTVDITVGSEDKWNQEARMSSRLSHKTLDSTERQGSGLNPIL